jgi:hypothetical protein
VHSNSSRRSLYRTNTHCLIIQGLTASGPVPLLLVPLQCILIKAVLHLHIITFSIKKPFSWFYRITRAWRKMVYYIQQLLRGQTHSSHACKQFAVSDWFKEDVSPASVFGFRNSFPVTWFLLLRMGFSYKNFDDKNTFLCLQSPMRKNIIAYMYNTKYHEKYRKLLWPQIKVFASGKQLVVCTHRILLYTVQS